MRTAAVAAALAAAAVPIAATRAAAAAAPIAAAPAPAACRGTVYLTLDTGDMRHAEQIASILARHDVRATFFVANEATPRGDHALDDGWAPFWRARVAEGHAFGSHTWRHGRILSDGPAGTVRYRPQFGEDAGRTLALDAPALCDEIGRVDRRFREIAGRGLDRWWRAPGGHLTGGAESAARGCGWTHAGWAPAGFLGDELPSDRFPNQTLVERALAGVRDGDILMAHLGIRSRRDPFAPAFEPLIAGLRGRGLCFATLAEHPVLGRGRSGSAR